MPVGHQRLLVRLPDKLFLKIVTNLYVYMFNRAIYGVYCTQERKRDLPMALGERVNGPTARARAAFLPFPPREGVEG